MYVRSFKAGILVVLALTIIIAGYRFGPNLAYAHPKAGGSFGRGSSVSARTNRGAPAYRLTDLGVINTQAGQMISHPAGINQAGEVTGYSYSGTEIHAARFTNGVVEDLGTIPGGSISTGVAINDLGQVTGDSQYSVNGGSIRHAALFSNGTATDLGFLPLSGNYSRGNGINNAGQVVGHSGPSLSTSNTRAFIWDAAGGMRDLGTLGGQFAKAFSINNSGVVTGTAQTLTGSFHAFIWDATNGMRDIGTIGGTTSSGAFINANGHVAGTSTIGSDNRQHAFLYDGVMHDLGAIGDNDFLSDRSTAYGINIHDHVVGTTYRPYQGGALFQIAFIYRDGEMFDLESLVDASGADYRLYTATGINNAGQIAVDAIKISTNQIRAVLLTPVRAGRTAFDFDGDGRSDVSVFRPTEGVWYLQQSAAGLATVQMGLSTDKVVPADYDGDGKTDVAVFRDGTWNLLRSQAGFASISFGSSGDIPQPADYDGDGKTDVAVWRPSNGVWYIQRSSDGAYDLRQFGMDGDKALSGDYDGDGMADIAIWRPSTGMWYVWQSGGWYLITQFGLNGDMPLAGDFDGDNKADIAVFRPSNGAWYILQSMDGNFRVFSWGIATDKPAPGDYDGDGKTDVAVFRESEGDWYVFNSSTGSYVVQRFGLNGDIPIPAAYVR